MARWCSDRPNAPAIAATDRRSGATSEMDWVPSGVFLMGSDCHYPEEAPAHRVSVDGFWMDRYPVTNERFNLAVWAAMVAVYLALNVFHSEMVCAA